MTFHCWNSYDFGPSVCNFCLCSPVMAGSGCLSCAPLQIHILLVLLLWCMQHLFILVSISELIHLWKSVNRVCLTDCPSGFIESEGVCYWVFPTENNLTKEEYRTRCTRMKMAEHADMVVIRSFRELMWWRMVSLGWVISFSSQLKWQDLVRPCPPHWMMASLQPYETLQMETEIQIGTFFEARPSHL